MLASSSASTSGKSTQMCQCISPTALSASFQQRWKNNPVSVVPTYKLNMKMDKWLICRTGKKHQGALGFSPQTTLGLLSYRDLQKKFLVTARKRYCAPQHKSHCQEDTRSAAPIKSTTLHPKNTAITGREGKQRATVPYWSCLMCDDLVLPSTQPSICWLILIWAFYFNYSSTGQLWWALVL